MARKRVQELTGMSPAGSSRIPYDQTDPLQQVGAPAVAGGPQASAMPGQSLPPGAPDLGAMGAPGAGPDQGAMDAGLAELAGGPPDQGGLPPGAAGDLGPGGPPPQPGLAGPEGAMGGVPPENTDQLTGADLAALAQPVGDVQSPEDQQVAQIDAMLSDPNTPPEQRQQLQQMMDLAARRRLAGLGGGGGGLGV